MTRVWPTRAVGLRLKSLDDESDEKCVCACVRACVRACVGHSGCHGGGVSGCLGVWVWACSLDRKQSGTLGIQLKV